MRPSSVKVVLLAIASSSAQICSRAVTGGAVAPRWRAVTTAAVAPGGGLLVASGTLSVGRVAEVGDGVRFCTSYNPLQPPPPLYSASATGAHNLVGLDSPDQEAMSKGPTRLLDRVSEDQH